MNKFDSIKQSLGILLKTGVVLSQSDRNKILRSLIILIKNQNFSEPELYRYLGTKYDFDPDLEKSLINMAVKYSKDPASENYLFQVNKDEGRNTPIEESKLMGLLIKLQNGIKELRGKNTTEQTQILQKINEEMTVLDGLIQNMIFTNQEQEHIELI